jgi:hypothetical protein
VLLGVLLVPTLGLVGDIVTDGTFVSTAVPGTAPLQVESTDRVDNLNADMVDGISEEMLYLAAELYTKWEVDALVAVATGGRTRIEATTSYPIVIDQAGSYVLTADLTVTAPDVDAISIEADNVTLDLAGHCLVGPSSGTGRGIYSAERQNIRVRNGVVSGFDYGLQISAGSFGGGNIVTGVTASDNVSCGIMANNAIIEDCYAFSNDGVGIRTVRGSIVRDSCARSNGSHGISLHESSAVDCVAVENGGDGIHITATAYSGSLIQGCNVSHNDCYGIYMEAHDNDNVVNCVGYNNGDGNVMNCGVGNDCYQNHLP